MPSRPRSKTVDPSVSATYHLSARCVRRAFLMGQDYVTRKDYSHRQEWIRDRVRFLAQHFAIEILFFGFLSNHYHLTIRNLPALVDGWDDVEIIRRSCNIFPSKFKRLGVKEKGRPTQEQLDKLIADRELVAEMRTRLAHPSWFMKQLNQSIARKANLEDECKGHFFEERFQAERIDDLFLLLICGLYVDLNEIGAGVADSYRNSRQTSLYARLKARKMRRRDDNSAVRVDGFLTPVFLREEPDAYAESCRASSQGLLDMSLDQYVELVDILTAHYQQTPRRDGRKPPLPKAAIAKHLSEKGLMPSLTGDIAV